MNIIEKVKSLVETFPQIEELHIDYTEQSDGSCGISSTGDLLVREDLLGNQTRRHNFILYTVWQSQSDYDRMANSGLLLRLQYYLESEVKKNHAVDEPSGVITKITCGNGMLYAVPNENFNGGVIYQLQIAVEYKIESEEN